MTADTRWLDDDEQRAWRAFLTAQRLLFDRLERQLQRDAGLPQAYYEILVRLSEAPDRTLRMSQLADSSLSSRSRLSHAVARLEAAGWVGGGLRRRPPRRVRRAHRRGAGQAAGRRPRARRGGAGGSVRRAHPRPAPRTARDQRRPGRAPVRRAHWPIDGDEREQPAAPSTRAHESASSRLGEPPLGEHPPVGHERPRRVRQPRPQLRDRHPPPVGHLLGLVAHRTVVPGLEGEQVAAQPARRPRRIIRANSGVSGTPVTPSSSASSRAAVPARVLVRGDDPARPAVVQAGHHQLRRRPPVHVDAVAVDAAQEHPAHPVPQRPRVDLSARRDPDHRPRRVVHRDRLGEKMGRFHPAMMSGRRPDTPAGHHPKDLRRASLPR